MHNLSRILVLLCTFLSLNSYSQTLYTYTDDRQGIHATVASGISATNLSLVNGPVSINACGSGFNSDTWSTSAAAFTTTYSAGQLTLTPDAGNIMTVTSMTFDLRRNPQGPQNMRYAYSIDGGATWINNGSDLIVGSSNCNVGSTFTWDMADFSSSTAVIFRVYGWNAGNVNGQQQLRNGIINGTACLSTAAIYPLGTAGTCKSDPFIFTTDECIGCTYQWYKNDNIISGATSSSYSTTKPAYYNVEVTQPGGCSAFSGYTLLSVDYNPNANIFAPNGNNICAPTPGTNIIVKVGYTETNSYQWYLNGDVYAGTGGDSWRIFPTEPGDYYCAITTDGGCTRATETLSISNDCKIANNSVAELTVSPNPASSEIAISMNGGVNADAIVIIINSIGEIVFSENTNVENGLINKNININDLNSGIYFVKVVSGGNAFTSRFVVSK